MSWCPTLRSGQPTGWPERPDSDSRAGIVAGGRPRPAPGCWSVAGRRSAPGRGSVAGCRPASGCWSAAGCQPASACGTDPECRSGRWSQCAERHASGGRAADRRSDRAAARPGSAHCHVDEPVAGAGLVRPECAEPAGSGRSREHPCAATAAAADTAVEPAGSAAGAAAGLRAGIAAAAAGRSAAAELAATDFQSDVPDAG